MLYTVTDAYNQDIGTANTLEDAQKAGDMASEDAGHYLVIRDAHGEPVSERFLGKWAPYPVR